MMKEKLKDVKDFVRELIKAEDFEDEIFLESFKRAKEELIRDKEEGEYFEESLSLGDKLYMDLQGDSAMVLQKKDEFNLFLRWDNSTLEDYRAITYGKVELGFQIYPKKEFGLYRDFIGFTLAIDGLLECSAFPVDLNFSSKDFYLSKDLDYTFEIILIEGKEGVVKALRKIKIPREFCNVIRECYLKITKDEYRELEGLEDRINIQLKLKKIGAKRAECNYGVYKIKNEIELSKLNSYIKLI